jgi:hypothetical protein
MARAKPAKPVILTAEQIAALHLIDAHVGSATGAIGEITRLATDAAQSGVPVDQVLAAAGHERLAQLVDYLGALESKTENENGKT